MIDFIQKAFLVPATGHDVVGNAGLFGIALVYDRLHHFDGDNMAQLPKITTDLCHFSCNDLKMVDMGFDLLNSKIISWFNSLGRYSEFSTFIYNI